MIRILIVDDSPTARQFMRAILQDAEDFSIVGEARDGLEAVEQTRQHHPDIILMDIVMPRMDGLEATQIIMAQTPTPIVMVSGALQGQETEMAFRAIKQGALTLLPKPVGLDHPHFQAEAERLRTTLRALSRVRVIHHISPRTSMERGLRSGLQQTLSCSPQVVAVASSTGGPAALAEIFQNLPADFPLPIVAVQHIAGDFLNSLLSWLRQVSPLRFELAQAGHKLEAGCVTFAPIGQHLVFDADKRTQFQALPPSPHIPSADVLFHSIAEHYGSAAIGVVLTGMGADGAEGLRAMAQRGAVTIAQDEASSTVFGMPAEAIRLGAVRHTLPLTMIATLLTELTQPG